VETAVAVRQRDAGQVPVHKKAVAGERGTLTVGDENGIVGDGAGRPIGLEPEFEGAVDQFEQRTIGPDDQVIRSVERQRVIGAGLAKRRCGSQRDHGR
jgi:hypothetical protein